MYPLKKFIKIRILLPGQKVLLRILLPGQKVLLLRILLPGQKVLKKYTLSAKPVKKSLNFK